MDGGYFMDDDGVRPNRGRSRGRVPGDGAPGTLPVSNSVVGCQCLLRDVDVRRVVAVALVVVGSSAKAAQLG
jgi:hypothetical protein